MTVGTRCLHWLRVLEAGCAIALAQALILLLPSKLLAAWLGIQERPAFPTAQPQAPVPLAVASALRRASARLPWRPTCLAKALGGAWMLRWRGVPATLVLGVTHRGGRLRAHAWLLSDGSAICGEREALAFVPIAGFRGGKHGL